MQSQEILKTAYEKALTCYYDDSLAEESVWRSSYKVCSVFISSCKTITRTQDSRRKKKDTNEKLTYLV